MRRLFSTVMSTPFPEFKIAQGLGGALHITLQPGQNLIVQRGSVLSMSLQIKSFPDTDGGVLVAVSRLSSGGPFQFDSLTNSSSEPKKAIIAPKSFGTTTFIDTNGISEYYLLKDSFLACSSTLTLSSKAKGLGLGINGYFNYLVKGKGIIAFYSSSGLENLKLEDSESVLINPRMLIAWESCLNPVPVKIDYTPPKILMSKNDSQILDAIRKTGLFLYSIMRNSVLYVWNSVLGSPVEYYSIKGPGKYIMATQEPHRPLNQFLKVFKNEV